MKNKKETDGNSSKNQEIKRKFISREVLCNVNSMVEYILQKGFEDRNAPFTIDDVENYYTVNRENIIYNILNDWDEKKNEFKEYANGEDYNRRVKTQNDFEVFLKSLDESDFETLCDDFNYEHEQEAAEVFEWWMVTGWLLEKLKEKGEVVINSEGIWGRQTTGQAILLDGVITEICRDMEILEGQTNDWSK